MHFNTIAAAGLSMIGFAAAAPAAPELSTRACTTIQPSFVSYIDAASPNQAFVFAQPKVSLVRGPPNTRKTLVRFDPPAGATGCTLSVTLQPKFTYGTGATGVNIFTTKEAVNNSFTWAKPPTKDAQVSYFDFYNWRSVPYTQNLASGECKAGQSYLFEQADWQQQGGNVDFTNGNQNGFALTYNC